MCENGAESIDAVDPRVQIELETLNNATDEINRLESELEMCRNAFRNLLCDSAAKIDALRLKLGLCVERAKPYYEARFCANEALKQTQVAAMKYEKANSAHSAAKEMVYLAEQGLGGRTLDPAWQEMLNHATQRVNESEQDKSISGNEHRLACIKHEAANSKVKMLQKELKRAIAKSRLSIRRNFMTISSLASRHDLLFLPYYEMKAHYNQLLECQRTRINNLESQVSSSKLTYAAALKNLEQISDEIHRNRNSKAKLSASKCKQASMDSTESYVDFAEEYKTLSDKLPMMDIPPMSSSDNPEMDGYKLLPTNTALSPASTIDDKVMPVDMHSGEWTEINLDVSSPEEEQESHGRLHRQKTLPNPILDDSEFDNVKRIKSHMDSVRISNWIQRSSAAKQRSESEEMRTIFCGIGFDHSKLSKNVAGRRQSLDNILGPTGEKMKEIWSQGMMMLNISALTERRGSESRVPDAAKQAAGKKLPSPLEKTLTYLNIEDDTSDCESLSSVDMLNEEQINCLMLDKDLQDVCEQVLGTPINEVVASNIVADATATANSDSLCQ